MGSDPLHLITAKIYRRLIKFEASGAEYGFQDDWMNDIHTQTTAIHDFAVEKWKAIETVPRKHLSTTTIRSLQPQEDLDITMPDLDIFIDDIESRQKAKRAADPKLACSIVVFPANELPDAAAALSGSTEHKFFVLAALEQWVQDHQHSWIDMHKHDIKSCSQLRHLMEKYHSTAREMYAGIPASMSIMYLTLVELWIMSDRSACHIYPLLKDFEPEVYIDQFQCLSLPRKKQMKRLLDAERYVQARQGSAQEDQPSIYKDFGHKSSFAVKYFDQSLEMQALKAKIEREATTKRQKKWQEFARVKREYENLMARYDKAECDFQAVERPSYISGDPETYNVHKADCARCKLKRDAEALGIDVHEWPLSPKTAVAKATVFELNPPEAFLEWRATSFYLIMDVLRFSYVEPRIPGRQYSLLNHKDLSEMPSRPQYLRRRIVPLSEIKSHSDTLYRLKVSVAIHKEQSVCPDNALVYKYYDFEKKVWCTALRADEELPRNFYYTLPARSSALERFLYRPPSTPDGLSSNESIVSQLISRPTGILDLQRNVSHRRCVHADIFSPRRPASTTALSISLYKNTRPSLRYHLVETLSTRTFWPS